MTRSYQVILRELASARDWIVYWQLLIRLAWATHQTGNLVSDIVTLGQCRNRLVGAFPDTCRWLVLDSNPTG